jgi:hypothetical protein
MSESRKKYHDPEAVLNNAGATQGMVIADLGSGPAFSRFLLLNSQAKTV